MGTKKKVDMIENMNDSVLEQYYKKINDSEDVHEKNKEKAKEEMKERGLL
jgi:hypothetical protein